MPLLANRVAAASQTHSVILFIGLASALQNVHRPTELIISRPDVLPGIHGTAQHDLTRALHLVPPAARVLRRPLVERITPNIISAPRPHPRADPRIHPLPQALQHLAHQLKG